MLTLLKEQIVPSLSADNALQGSLKTWIVIALLGQWAFAIYILSLYALPLLIGAAEQADKVSPTQGFDSTGSFNSFMFFGHIIPAAFMAISGIFQLSPGVRKNYPRFHRYNGRMFLFFGLCGALTGLYLSWGVGIRLSDIGALGVTLNGLLIPVFILLAWRSAVNKQFAAHQRWAVHSFILVNGVWAFRLFLMGWYVINQGPNGNTRNLDGPADITLSFLCYLLPMFIAELYFWAKKRRTDTAKWLATGAISIAVVITLIGVGAATMMMWSPRVMMIFNTLF
ncbi:MULTISPECIES: DUF2306 domain-containing protein [unclassified Pseudoalteromonas]|uniref:DUF2306 domain-containing protein n=1 Tax=unclassified Pseudoalteromonas TaxID=194690 RepID=UPI002096F391|nr:DUF2306 domain-containing protein [Pseudoalteromonas sp. XMcav2-N]MCO7188900.1 DUF2306 domain-containing protein [Pseudoalteromonas sp. XMcav2-N]